MIEVEFEQVLRSKAKALIDRDSAFLDLFIHKDFRYVTASGFEADKASYIDGVCGSDGLRFEKQEISNLNVVTWGDAAIVTCGLADVFVARGTRHVKSFKTLLVLVKVGGAWRWLAGQTMEPAAN
jgi:hypothetical protein